MSTPAAHHALTPASARPAQRVCMCEAAAWSWLSHELPPCSASACVEDRTWSSNQVTWDRRSAGPAALRPGSARRVRDRVCAPAQDVRVAGARALRRRGRRGGLPCRAGRRAAPAHAARLVAGRHQRRGAPWLASVASLRSLPRRTEAGSGGAEATACGQHVVA